MSAEYKASGLAEHNDDPVSDHHDYLFDMLSELSNIASGMGEFHIADVLRSIAEARSASGLAIKLDCPN